MTIEWEKEVTLVDGVECVLGHDKSQWFCHAQSGPRFCFVGGSREDAIGIAERAIKMYWNYEYERKK